ncbi:MAG TPA: alpha/beta hydrolase, partial [Stellaceae bacterium]|nr:alpha/beta hydrolase [Stellaceae bacterium]
MAAPRTQYARVDGLNIAYQVVGDGPIDLLHIPGFLSNVELAWEVPPFAAFLNRLASFSRLILFDKRGTGMSDRLPRGELPTLDKRIEDILAVLDAAGSTRAVIVSHSEGGNMAVLFTATYPDRVRALVTCGIFASRIWSPEYPWAPTPEARARDIEETEKSWGGTDPVDHLAPSLASRPAERERVARYFRLCGSPGDAAALLRMNTQIDIRAILPTIQVPTLVMHRTGDLDASVEEGQWIASRIPGAKFLELPGNDHMPWVGDADSVLDAIEEFVTGAKPAPSFERVLTTVLFTDLVGSTAMAAELGDR